MPPNPAPPRRDESLAGHLRDFAHRAHKLLKRGRLDEDQEKVRTLLAEVADSRRRFHDDISSPEVRDWFDRLEQQLTEALEAASDDQARAATRPRVGVA